jgi:hypothetical protein
MFHKRSTESWDGQGGRHDEKKEEDTLRAYSTFSLKLIPNFPILTSF